MKEHQMLPSGINLTMGLKLGTTTKKKMKTTPQFIKYGVVSQVVFLKLYFCVFIYLDNNHYLFAMTHFYCPTF
jgi:hypothetical protein